MASLGMGLGTTTGGDPLGTTLGTGIGSLLQAIGEEANGRDPYGLMNEYDVDDDLDEKNTAQKTRIQNFLQKVQTL